ncbi:hypothetical protein RDI58_024211 [Solanum bulbocastanum]|uniref:Uncharacterized protein n=1 Tax=Solanum bulbocastanum TaxID=147425 RepID=A0AAN8SXS6_SOLBU
MLNKLLEGDGDRLEVVHLQHRSVRQGRTLTSNNSDDDSEIIRNDVPRSIQNTLRDQRAWMKEGRRKYEKFK